MANVVDITVVRGAGDRQGVDIVDPLIADDAVAISRGRQALDDTAQSMQSDRVSIVYRSGVRLGQSVKVMDELRGISWVGKITSIWHRIEENKVYTDLTIIHATDFLP